MHGSEVTSLRLSRGTKHYSLSWYVCRPGRPITKKVISDRKSVGRPRRLLGISVAVLSGMAVRFFLLWLQDCAGVWSALA